MRTKSLVVRHNTWAALLRVQLNVQNKWKGESTKSTSESKSANKYVSIEEKESVDKRESGGEKAKKVKVLALRCKLCCPPNKSPGGLCCSPGRVLKPHKISELGYLKR